MRLPCRRSRYHTGNDDGLHSRLDQIQAVVKALNEPRREDVAVKCLLRLIDSSRQVQDEIALANPLGRDRLVRKPVWTS